MNIPIRYYDFRWGCLVRTKFSSLQVNTWEKTEKGHCFTSSFLICRKNWWMSTPPSPKKTLWTSLSFKAYRQLQLQLQLKQRGSRAYIWKCRSSGRYAFPGHRSSLPFRSRTSTKFQQCRWEEVKTVEAITTLCWIFPWALPQTKTL